MGEEHNRFTAITEKKQTRSHTERCGRRMRKRRGGDS